MYVCTHLESTLQGLGHVIHRCNNNSSLVGLIARLVTRRVTVPALQDTPKMLDIKLTALVGATCGVLLVLQVTLLVLVAKQDCGTGASSRTPLSKVSKLIA